MLPQDSSFYVHTDLNKTLDLLRSVTMRRLMPLGHDQPIVKLFSFMADMMTGQRLYLINSIDKAGKLIDDIRKDEDHFDFLLGVTQEFITRLSTEEAWLDVVNAVGRGLMTVVSDNSAMDSVTLGVMLDPAPTVAGVISGNDLLNGNPWLVVMHLWSMINVRIESTTS
jgi:hypothetical protein